MGMFLRLEPRRAHLMAAISGRGPNASATRSRLRLIVIQALVFSLFATLFVRLYYLQVVSGEEYHAQAASQSVREIVVQPQRGLIVDDMGRPLVANRTSWVVSVDRTMLGKMAPSQRDAAARPARRRSCDQRPARIRQRLVTCGDPGSMAGSCWNGSPYQPVPVATDVRQRSRCGSSSSREDYPAVLAAAAERARLPRAVRRQPRARARLPQPDHRGRSTTGRTTDGDASVNGASSVGRAGVEKQYDRWLRGMPGYQRVAVDSMGRVLGDDSEVERQPGRHPRHLDRRQGAGRGRAPARRTPSRPPAQTHDTGHRTQLRRRLRRRRGDGGQDRTDRRDGQPADVRPRRLGRRHHQAASWRGSTPRRPAPRCSAGPPRASSRRARRGSRS